MEEGEQTERKQAPTDIKRLHRDAKRRLSEQRLNQQIQSQKQYVSQRQLFQHVHVLPIP